MPTRPSYRSAGVAVAEVGPPNSETGACRKSARLDSRHPTAMRRGQGYHEDQGDRRDQKDQGTKETHETTTLLKQNLGV